MKKVLSSLAFVAFTAVFGQVAITADTTTTPKATLDVQALSAAGVTDGVLVPRMTYATATGMNATAVESTLVWLTDGDGTCGKGFYYYDETATDWEPVKSCGGSSSAAVPYEDIRGNVTYTNGDTDYDVQIDDHFIITNNGSTTTINFPTPTAAEAGRRVYVLNKNTVQGLLVYSGVSLSRTATSQHRGRVFVCTGSEWYSVGL